VVRLQSRDDRASLQGRCDEPRRAPPEAQRRAIDCRESDRGVRDCKRLFSGLRRQPGKLGSPLDSGRGEARGECRVGSHERRGVAFQKKRPAVPHDEVDARGQSTPSARPAASAASRIAASRNTSRAGRQTYLRRPLIGVGPERISGSRR